MKDPSQFNFAALYSFDWAHENCHLTQDLNVFPTIGDPRTKVETVVRPDTVSLNQEAVYGSSGFYVQMPPLQGQTRSINPTRGLSFWSRNTANSAWFLRTFSPNGILAPECQ